MSKRIEEKSSTKSKLFGIIPYVDPKSFTFGNKEKVYSLNKKSDIYSVGVLLWEISSGYPPFHTEGSYDIALALDISQGHRETTVPDTPDDYAKLYIGKYILNLIFLGNYCSDPNFCHLNPSEQI